MTAKVTLFAASLLALFVVGLGLYLRFDLDSFPYVSPDSWGHVGPALGALAGQPFEMLNGRSYPYPLFLLLVWSFTGSIRAVTVVQHLLGGIALLLFWFAICQCVRALGARRILYLPSLICGLCGLWLLATSTTVIQYEHYLGPEALMLVISSLLIFLHVRFARAVLVRDIEQRLGLLLGLLLFLNAFMFLIKPLYFLAVILCSIPPLLLYLYEVRRQTGGWRISALKPAIISAVLFLIIGIGADRIYRGKDPKGAFFGPMVLFSFNAPIIYPTLDSDLNQLGNDPLSNCLRRVRKNVHDSIVFGTNHPTAADFNGFGNTVYYGDAMIYGVKEIQGEPATRLLLGCYDGESERVADFYWKYAIAGFKNRPKALYEKIINELKFFYGENGRRVTRQPLENPSLQEQRRRMINKMDYDLLSQSPVGIQLISFASTSTMIVDPIVTQLPSFLSAANDWYRPALVLLIVGAIIDLIFGLSSRGFGEAGSFFPYLAVTIPLFNFGVNLGIAIAHSLWVGRYIESQFYFTIFTLTYAALYAIVLIWGALCTLLTPFIDVASDT